MNHKNQGIKGFTLMEILFVIIILAILVLLAILQYSKTLEMNRADQAASLVRQVAAANHMYSLDNTPMGAAPSSCIGLNPGTYLSGQITNTCNSDCCSSSPSCATSATDPCNLVACGYLPKRDWGSLPYNVFVLKPASDQPATVCGSNFSGVTGTCYGACVTRNGGSTPYSSWGYALYYSTDTIDTVGGAPSP
jgi:prepilin-type N-terminal cleavage/methylation domain-containing protein